MTDLRKLAEEMARELRLEIEAFPHSLVLAELEKKEDVALRSALLRAMRAALEEGAGAVEQSIPSWPMMDGSQRDRNPSNRRFVEDHAKPAIRALARSLEEGE